VTLSIVAVAQVVEWLLGRAWKEKLYKYASYFGHYGPLYAGYGFRDFLKKIATARNVISFYADTWLRRERASLPQSCVMDEVFTQERLVPSEKEGSKLRVLYLDKEGGFGGSSRSLYFLIKNLDRRRVEAQVVLRERGPALERLQRAGSQDVPS